MLSRVPSARKLSRLNRRQRKKLRVGEFQELVFDVTFTVSQSTPDPANDDFMDAFLNLIESRNLAFCGVSNLPPLNRTDGTVAAAGRGSASDDDRQAVSAWLQQRPEVANLQIGELFDGWYGEEDRQ